MRFAAAHPKPLARMRWRKLRINLILGTTFRPRILDGELAAADAVVLRYHLTPRSIQEARDARLALCERAAVCQLKAGHSLARSWSILAPLQVASLGSRKDAQEPGLRRRS